MNAYVKVIPAAVVTLVLSSAAQADGLVKVEQTIFGMDCAPCAYGMEKNIGKLQGVAKVDVRIEQGLAVIDFTPDARTTLAEIHDVVLHGGLTPEKVTVTVQGVVEQHGDALVLTDGSSEHYALVGLSAAQAASLRPGARAQVHGEASLASGDPAVTIKVQDLKAL